jgi:hypothetical protein
LFLRQKKAEKAFLAPNPSFSPMENPQNKKLENGARNAFSAFFNKYPII